MLTLLRDVRAGIALARARGLAGQVYYPEGVKIWLTAKNRNLGGHSPIEMILDGHGDLVVAEADRIAGLAW